MARSTIPSMKKQGPKVIENRLRDTLRRRGYRLEKSRRRDPHALTYQRYWVIWEKHEANYAGFVLPATEGDSERAYTMTLDQVDAWVRSGKQPSPLDFQSDPKLKPRCYAAMWAYEAERKDTATAPQQESKAAPTGRRRK